MRTLLGLVLLAFSVRGAELPHLDLTPKGPTLRFAVTGDAGEGAGAVAKGIARVHAETPLDAILLTGDNFYPCGVTSVTDPRWSLELPLTRIGIPIFPVLGNHDSCGKSDQDAQIRATGVIPHWHFPARQYGLRTPVADFAFVDTSPYVYGSKERISGAVEKAFAGSVKPWRVLVGHHPVFSSGYHGYFPRDQVAKMRALIPMLRDQRIDLYICGHDHHVELIRGRMVHLISGAGSDPIPPIKLRANTVFPDQIRLERIGFAVVEISAKLIRVRIYDGAGKPRTEWIPAARKK